MRRGYQKLKIRETELLDLFYTQSLSATSVNFGMCGVQYLWLSSFGEEPLFVIFASPRQHITSQKSNSSQSTMERFASREEAQDSLDPDWAIEKPPHPAQAEVMHQAS